MACQCMKHGFSADFYISKDLLNKVFKNEVIQEYIKIRYTINNEPAYTICISKDFKEKNNLSMNDGDVLPLQRKMPEWYYTLKPVCSQCFKESTSNHSDKG